jgi:predicted SAM-dependent methyltransferase
MGYKCLKDHIDEKFVVLMKILRNIVMSWGLKFLLVNSYYIDL